jgi:hypothetical protein
VFVAEPAAVLGALNGMTYMNYQATSNFQDQISIKIFDGVVSV